MMIRHMPRWQLVLAGLCLLVLSSTRRVASQEPITPAYESRFVEANGVRLQYMDFGGEGAPLIFVQDVHNMFADEDPYFRDLWTAFYSRFTGTHRVLATVRRGYGESESPGWGYDVPTQSEDLLGLMDALGIARAVLFGRTTANQDMVWIAEHHPDRVAGLILLGNPPLFTVPESPDARRFDYLYSLASCDLQERAVELLAPRNSWRPRFLKDSAVRIAVPSLRFHNPTYDRRGIALQRLDRIEGALGQTDSTEAACPGEEPYRAFVDSLAGDQQRRDAIRQAFEAGDMSVAVDDGITRAFGTNLDSVREPGDLEGWADYFDFMLPHLRRFLATRTRAYDGE